MPLDVLKKAGGPQKFEIPVQKKEKQELGRDPRIDQLLQDASELRFTTPVVRFQIPDAQRYGEDAKGDLGVEELIRKEETTLTEQRERMQSRFDIPGPLFTKRHSSQDVFSDAEKCQKVCRILCAISRARKERMWSLLYKGTAVTAAVGSTILAALRGASLTAAAAATVVDVSAVSLPKAKPSTKIPESLKGTEKYLWSLIRRYREHRGMLVDLLLADAETWANSPSALQKTSVAPAPIE